MHSKRNEGLDIFRGLAIASMIVVNNQGNWEAVYRPLRHAGWHGFTPADTIFPAFLFVAGISLYYNLNASLESGVGRSRAYALLLRRALLIFLLGLSLNVPLDLNFSVMRFTGVLQRIAICLSLSAVPVLFLRRGGILASAIGCSIIYWVVVLTIAAPGYTRGDLTPAGSLAAYIDSSILGSHRYLNGGVPVFDPEGIATTLGAVSTTLLGSSMTPFLRSERSWPVRLCAITISGIIFTITGILLSNAIPLNKPLWTPSYVMLSSGISCLFLTPLCFIADHKGHGKFLLPFKAMGVSPLILYYFSSLAGNLSVKVMVSKGSSGLIVPVKHCLFYATFGYVAGPAGSLLYSLMFLLIFIIFALIIMHAKQRLTAGSIVPVPQGELPSSSQ